MDLVDKIYELVKDCEDPDAILYKVYEKLGINNEEFPNDDEDVLTPEEVSGKEIRFKELAAEIFNLCPKCNYIPLAIEYVNGSDYITTKDWDELYDAVIDYMGIETENVCPHFLDEMTLKDWKTVVNDWQEMIDLSDIEEGSVRGDYCEMYHLSVYVYSKESENIEYIGDINR